ncbi:YlqD family protein [Alicyclobacillus sp. ALC3]|uniref:YlqD family protein n=1 Tax=Alicyclobacillus sp. ALC3 TaxID=2796143 RepID=UPI0023785B12|nr:YlqD family protein [Alicyclobacillus sp. ALC3]
MLSIRQPVAVKFILTELTKQQILTEHRRQIDHLTEELEQLEIQGKEALEQAMAAGGDVAQQVREQIEQERMNREQQREQLIQQIQQIQQMELGTEIQNMNVETSVDVRVGDDWGKILRGAEIVIKDGIVYEIRSGGESVRE